MPQGIVATSRTVVYIPADIDHQLINLSSKTRVDRLQDRPNILDGQGRAQMTRSHLCYEVTTTSKQLNTATCIVDKVFSHQIYFVAQRSQEWITSV